METTPTLYSKTGMRAQKFYEKKQQEFTTGITVKYMAPTLQLSEIKHTSRKSIEEIRTILQANKAADAKNTPQRERPVATPDTKSHMFKAQSRENLDKKFANKDVVPPCGHYEPKYKQQDKKEKAPVMQKPKKHEERLKFRTGILLSYRVKPQKKHIPSPIKFHMQSDRPKHTAESSRGPSPRDPPQQTCKNAPNIDKYLPRPAELWDTSSQPNIYKPRYHLVSRGESKTIDWNKVPSREGKRSKSQNLLQELQYNKKFSYIDPKPKHTRMRSTGDIPRQQSSLPSYLQRCYSRNSVGLMNDKALQMNCYSDGNFYNRPVSSWGWATTRSTKKTPTKKRKYKIGDLLASLKKF